jgi:hypothetical protein
VALVFGKDGHWAKCCAVHVTDGYWAVHDVAHNSSIYRRDEGKQRGAVRPQRVDYVAFLVLAEGAVVNFANGRKVFR